MNELKNKRIYVTTQAGPLFCRVAVGGLALMKFMK